MSLLVPLLLLVLLFVLLFVRGRRLSGSKTIMNSRVANTICSKHVVRIRLIKMTTYKQDDNLQTTKVDQLREQVSFSFVRDVLFLQHSIENVDL